jgi:D-arabinose 1-dehydrogenase-like Zn-dependent alcohol dehydrogenase
MSPSMKVARLVKAGSPLEVGSAEQPSPGPMEVVVKVAACGLVRSFDRLLHPPLFIQR